MASDWVDSVGTPWKYSASTGSWQTLIGGAWINSPMPSGGLRRVKTTQATGNVIVVDTMGPTGPTGPPGPPGTNFFISEVLPAQFQDGVNDTFPLSATADISQAFQVFRNGLMEVRGHGYTVTSTHVTFTTPPLDSDVLTVIYQKAQ